MGKKEKVAILSISFLTLVATIAVSPALNAIQTQFNTAPELLIQLIVTLPALICIPINLSINIFVKFISKKNLTIIGLCIYFIGGILSAIAPNIYILLLTRALLGVGLGILAPLSFVIIGDLFKGKEKAKFMGYSSAVTNLGGIVSTLIVGVLSGINWRFSFFVYFITIIVIILVVFALPNDKETDEYTSLKEENLKELKADIKLNKSVFKYAIIVFLALVAFYALPTGIDFLLKAKGSGNSQIASTIVAISTCASLVSAIFFSKMMSVLKKYTSIILFVLLIIGFILIASFSNIAIIMIAAVLVGFGFGSIIPYTIFYASSIVHETHSALAITILSTGLYVGEFISPILLNLTSSIFDFTSASATFYSASIISLIGLIVAIYTIISERNKKVML
ncbi:MAG: MFS transporter [Sarcina sp.]